MNGRLFAKCFISMFGVLTCLGGLQAQDLIYKDALYLERYGYWAGKLGSGKIRLLLQDVSESGMVHISWMAYESNLSREMNEVCSWKDKTPDFEGKKIHTKDSRINGSWIIEVAATGSSEKVIISCSTKLDSAQDCTCTKRN